MKKLNIIFLIIMATIIMNSCEKIRDAKYEGDWDFSITKRVHKKTRIEDIDTAYYSTYRGFIKSEKYKDSFGNEGKALKLQFGVNEFIYINVDSDGSISKTDYWYGISSHVSITGSFSDNNKSLTCSRSEWSIVDSHANSTTIDISGKKK